MEENPVWAAIWDELQRDFEKRHTHVHALIVCELSPDTPDFDFVPLDGGSTDFPVEDTRISSEEV